MSEKVKKEKEQKAKKTIWPFVNTVLIFVVAGLCYITFQKNAVIQTLGVSADLLKISELESKIEQLENLVKTYQRENSGVDLQDVVALNEKIDNIGKVNTDLLESKASLVSVMGVVERVDNLELEIKKLGSVTSQGALILTSAGLVEEAAKKREPFMYEASVLEELSKNTPMEKSAHIIAGIAVKGLPLREDLIEKFIKIYELSFMNNNVPEKVEMPILKTENQEQKNWLTNLKDKLSTLIVIEKIKEPGEIETTQEQVEEIDEVYRLVRNGEFETAILKMNATPKYQTESFGVWIEEVRSEKVFDREMAKIKALTLGTMKTESLKQGIK